MAGGRGGGGPTLRLTKEAGTLKAAAAAGSVLTANVDDLRVVIPSLGRAETVGPTLALFPPEVVTLVVSQEEAERYHELHPAIELAVHPGLRGLGITRQWILDNIRNDVVFMADDDLPGCWSLVGHRIRRIRDPQAILAVVRGAARCAAEAGTPLFGFAINADPRNFKAQSPLALGGFVTGAMGVIGRDPRLRFDPAQRTKAEIDYSLQVLLYHRFIWKDTRFSFNTGGEFQNPGGNSGLRTLETVREDIVRLKHRWGSKVIDTSSDRRARGKKS